MINPNNSREELRIYKYGEEVLRENAEKIEKVDDSVKNLINKMKRIMIEKNGVGLAAPQVGKSIQLIIVDPTVGEDPKEFLPLINPEIIESEGEETGEEGCLSVPGILLEIKRSKTIKLKALDINGKEFTKEYSDFKARIIQHEIDHLKGTLIIDKISPLKRQLVKKDIKKLKKNGEW